MSPRTGRPSKKGRTDKTITIRLSEQESVLIEELAEFFDTSKNNIIIESLKYLKRDIEENDCALQEYLERNEGEFLEAETEKRLERYENRILDKLEKWEREVTKHFYETILPEQEEKAKINEQEFDQDEALYNFHTFLEERRDEVETEIKEDYENRIIDDLEEEWEEHEKYTYIREYFKIED